MQEGEPKPRGKQSRQERLEAELRENLRRRKEQARARAQTSKGTAPDRAADKPDSD